MSDLKKEIGDILLSDPSIYNIIGDNLFYGSAPENISSDSFLVYFINTTGSQKDIEGNVLWRTKNVTIYLNSYSLSELYQVLENIYNVIEEKVYYLDLVIDDRPFWDDENKWHSIVITISMQDF